MYSPKLASSSLVRKFISLGGAGYVAISIQDGGGSQAAAVDADTGTIALAIWFNNVLNSPAPASSPYGTQVLTVTADSIFHDDTGKYHYDIGPSLTNTRGLITAIWTYQINGVAFQFIDNLQVQAAMPVYDSLSDQDKLTVEQVTWMFGDMYDCVEGGPHLIEEFQTHWDYERIAQMMQIATMKANYIGNYSNPPTQWSVGVSTTSSGTGGLQLGQTVTMGDGNTYMVTDPGGVTSSSSSSSSSSSGGTQIPVNFYGLIVWGTYIECMRHFRDSYTELPNRPGMDVTYTDRRDYFNRWAQNLQYEEQSYKQALKAAKLSLLGISRGSLLVAGGIYGGSALGIFQSGTYASQVRSWRFYPAAPAVMFGAVRR